MSTTLSRTAVLAAVDPALPVPPSDQEKYGYLGPQHRWLPWLQAVSFTLIAGSVARFAVGDLRLLLFLAPMTLYAVTMVVSLLSSTRRRRVSRASHVRLVDGWRPLRTPSVDVFLPSAGEPLDLLANTYRYVSQLRWAGRLTVWVLDDSARPEVADLADQFGFEYRTRPDRGRLKKAGNLKFGYEQSTGDYIAIFDADFVPRPEYLYELVPYFDDAEIGIVQSPQYFETRRGRMHWLQRCAGATQELFYRWIQPSRDRSKAAICVGTCAVYRRAALAAAGGFAQIGHSEDVHTGVKLLKVGFRVQYVPIVISTGVCPDTLGGFLNQQYRWCTGSMSLLADRSFHESPVIGLRQKLCFWAGFLYYISTAVNAVVAPLPAIAMLWLLPRWVEPMNSIWLVGAILLWLVVLPLVMRSRWRVDVVRVQHLYSFAHLTAIIHVLTGRTREWVATGAANRRSTPLAVSITRIVKPYILITQAVLWIGLIRGALTYGLGEYWAMIALGVLGSYLQLPILTLRLTNEPRTVRQRAADVLQQIRAPFGRRWVPAPAPAFAAAAVGLRVAQPPASSMRPLGSGHGSPAPARSAPDGADGPRRFRPDIQGLRAVAVLLVVLYHANVPGISGGYVGVDVFYVISGFLITGQLLREVERTGRISFLSFYGGRMRRLLPPAAVVVIVTVIAARFVDSILHVRSVALDAIFATFYAANYRLAALGVDYQNANGPESPLQHMWSLSLEEQFYLLWPLLIALCAWLGGRYRLRLLASLLAAGASVSLWLSVTQTVANPPYAYFGLHTRAWELALGALAAMAVLRLSRMPAWLATLGSWTGITLIVASGLIYTDETAFPGTAALVPTLGALLVVAGGCRFTPAGAEWLLALRPMRAIGAVSYSWYLWHWPALILIPLAAGHDLPWLYQLEISGLALWLAALTYFLVERPALRSRFRRTAWLLGGAASMGVIVVVSVVVLASLPPLVGAGAPATPVTLTNQVGVQKAVVDGLSVMRAPSNVRPTVKGAVSDQPASSADGCHANYSQVAQPDCVYGDPAGTHTLVLFGDSHSQQWLPALDAQAKLLHWRVVAWTKAACPIADVEVINSALGRDYTECYAWRQSTKTRIEKLNPDIIIVSQSDTVAGTQVTNTQWGDATARSLLDFKRAGIPLAYILDTPYLAKNAPDCVASHLDNVGACNLLRSQVAPYANRRASVAAALDGSNITVLDPMDFFCTSIKCPVIVGDILVYRDASHMSATYARWLAPLTGPLFVERKR